MPSVAIGSAALACIVRCGSVDGVSITNGSNDFGGKKTCKCLKNSTVVDGYLVAAAKTVASADVPNTRTTFGRTTSLPIGLKTDERFGCWW